MPFGADFALNFRILWSAFSKKLAPANVPVLDNYWMTETGWPIAANAPGLGVKAGS